MTGVDAYANRYCNEKVRYKTDHCWILAIMILIVIAFLTISPVFVQVAETVEGIRNGPDGYVAG
jgi:hypothetical protein